MMKKHIKPGMTLIETIFYFTLLSLLMGTIMTFAIQVINMNKKSDNLREAQANLEFVTRTIVNTVQTANDVDDANSIFANDTGKLSLAVDDSGRTPTQFFRQDNDVYLKFGQARR
jgi:type II secretory pathway pseudopilin PulG